MNIIKSYTKLTKEVKEFLVSSYPNGFEGYTKSVQIKGESFLVVPLRFGSENYYIKLTKLTKDKGSFDIASLANFDDEQDADSSMNNEY